MSNYKERLKDIKAFVFDVDGVFTDGSILLLPDGNQTRAMSTQDGYAVATAVKAGYNIGIITGGRDLGVKMRMNYLGVTDVYLASTDKIEDYEDFKAKYSLKDQDVLYMGDDVPDMPVMLKVNIAACPINSVPEIKEIAHYISNVEGGKGCVRDVIRQVMKIQQKWPADNSDKTQSV